MAVKKYYWLKLKRDFFKRHDIRIIESMPNGKEYVLFYLKLMMEAIDHNGALRFSDTIPYNEQMLSVITDTNIDIVRSAMKILRELNLVEMMDDSTLYVTETEKLIGSETEWAEKKRIYRGQCPHNVLALSDKSIEIDKDKDIDIYIEKSKEKRFTPPTLDEVKAYIEENHYNVDAERFINFYESKGWMIGKNKMKDWKAGVRNWNASEPSKKKGSFDTDDFFQASLNRTRRDFNADA